MTIEFKLPDLGEGIHEAEIINVLVEEGGPVDEDQPIFEVETDKAVVEIPSPYSGTVEKIFVAVGETVKVGNVMVSFASDAGSEAKALSGAGAAVHSLDSDSARSQITSSAISRQSSADTGYESVSVGDREHSRELGNGRLSLSNGHVADRSRPVPAAPTVRRLARELGIDLYDVVPSGAAGRVLKEDVRAHAAGALESSMAATSTTQPISLAQKYGDVAGGTVKPLESAAQITLPDFSRFGEVERVPLKSIRRKIAESMALSWSRIPHVTTFDEADVTEIMALIESSFESFKTKSGGGRLTLTVLMIKAVVSALKRFPQFNSSLDEQRGEIIFKNYFNIGIAVATERGLIVPVIKNADRKTIVEIAVELAEIAEKSRSGKIELERLQGGTFTITNIGAIGGTSMSPMINHPEAAILGMARAKKRPVVVEDEILIGNVLPLALSFDHRLADGAEAAYFVQHIVSLLEEPFNFVLEG